jgi:hypothetical protein
MLERCRSLAQASMDATYVDARLCAELIRARDAIERGAVDEALAQARDILALHGTGREFTEAAYELAVEAAIALEDGGAMGALDSYVSALPPARATPLLRAGRARVAAEQAHGSGDATAAQRLEDEAILALRAVGARPLLARALLDRCRRRDDREALDEALGICRELGASRWLSTIEPPAEVVS